VASRVGAWPRIASRVAHGACRARAANTSTNQECHCDHRQPLAIAFERWNTEPSTSEAAPTPRRLQHGDQLCLDKVGNQTTCCAMPSSRAKRSKPRHATRALHEHQALFPAELRGKGCSTNWCALYGSFLPSHEIGGFAADELRCACARLKFRGGRSFFPAL